MSWSVVAQWAGLVPLLLPVISRVSRHLLIRLTFAAAAKHPNRPVTLKVQRRLGTSYEISVGGPETGPRSDDPEEPPAVELPAAEDQGNDDSGA